MAARSVIRFLFLVVAFYAAGAFVAISLNPSRGLCCNGEGQLSCSLEQKACSSCDCLLSQNEGSDQEHLGYLSNYNLSERGNKNSSPEPQLNYTKVVIKTTPKLEAKPPPKLSGIKHLIYLNSRILC